MPNVNEAVNAFKGLTQHIKRLSTIGEYLESRQSLEAEDAGLRQQIEQTKDELRAEKARMLLAKQDALKAQDNADEILRSARAQADNIVAMAKTDAEEMSARTAEKANALMQKANADAAAKIQLAENEISVRRAQRDEMVAEHTLLVNEIAGMQEERDALESKIENAKAQIARMLG